MVFVYHEVHEDHEEFHILISLCVLRALRGEILSRYNLLSLCEKVQLRMSPYLRGRPPWL